MKTNELTGHALDWAVQMAEGYVQPDPITFARTIFNPSTNWAQGGPIIEREGISIEYAADPEKLCACIMADQEVYGPTAFIAAMLCYVASKLGDEIEMPKEITA
jgi:hypothetical protein